MRPYDVCPTLRTLQLIFTRSVLDGLHGIGGTSLPGWRGAVERGAAD